MEIDKSKFDSRKYWKIPKPTGDAVARPQYKRVSQVKFYNEYFPTGHKIFDREVYQDIPIYSDNGKFKGLYPVNRVSVPIQAMATDVILAHLLGNKSHIVDSTMKENPALPLYKEFWETRNIDIARYQFIRSALALGDAAILFYRKESKLNWQVLSFFNQDEFKMTYDKFGDPEKFYKYYNDKVDVYDDKKVTTYVLDDVWKQEGSSRVHGFKGLPVVYHKRSEGAFWSRSQSNIENMEVMLSRLSEDNRKKFKALYHMKTNDPESVITESTGMTDLIITDTDGDFKLIDGADISTQFKFEFETQLEFIYNSLGIVFPKHKSSGDMPTGSMKMMFYPTERVVMSLINEFDDVIDRINDIVKQGFVSENSKYTKEITDGNITASIRMFTPQDDASKVDSIVKLKQAKVISGETASDESPYASNNEEIRKEKEREMDIKHEREMDNMRGINPMLYGGWE